MSAIQDAMMEIFQEFEGKFVAAWVEEDGEEFFHDFTVEILDDCQDLITDYFLTLVPEIETGKLAFGAIPKIAASKNIHEFQIAFSAFKDKYPKMHEFIETLDASLTTWEPLYGAIRIYFNESRLPKIKHRNEFLIALRGYSNLEDMHFEFLPKLKIEIQILHKCIYARLSEILEIDNLLDMYKTSSYEYHAPLATFEGSTGGLENEIVEWIAKMSSAQSLFEDDDFDFSENPDPILDSNIESLKSNWLEKDSKNSTMFAGFVWQVIDANGSVDLDLGERSTFVRIDVLSQIRTMWNNNGEHTEDESKDYYKITLIRTGVREEYDPVMDKSLLALQIVMFHDNSNVPFENIEGEIAWLRLKENDYPLVGNNAEEIHEISKFFLDSQ